MVVFGVAPRLLCGLIEMACLSLSSYCYLLTDCLAPIYKKLLRRHKAICPKVSTHLPCLNSRRKLHQQRPIQSIIATIRREIHRLYPINRHRMHQTLHVSISSRVVRYNGALASIRAGDCVDSREICVVCLCILEFDHGVAVAEEPGWRETTGVEDDGSDV